MHAILKSSIFLSSHVYFLFTVYCFRHAHRQYITGSSDLLQKVRTEYIFVFSINFVCINTYYNFDFEKLRIFVKIFLLLIHKHFIHLVTMQYFNCLWAARS